MNQWPMVKLTDICRPKQWPTISGSDLLDSGYPVYGANGKIGFYSSFNHEEPTVLITCRGATCGTINVSESRSYVTGNAMALDKLLPEMDLGFLAHYLRHRRLDDVISGTAQPQITREGLANLTVPKPNQTEQRRIAAILDQAEALRAKRRRALAKLDTLTQSLFLEMFGDPTRPNPRWPFIPFGSIADCQLGKMLDGKKQTGATAFPYLRNANVQWNRLELGSLWKMDFHDRDRTLFELKRGDLLICEGGEPGRPAVWNNELTECFYQKALHRCRFKPGVGMAKFYVFLLWELAKRGSLHYSTSTIGHLTAEKLKALRIPNFPYPQQLEFSNKAEAIERVIQSHLVSEADLSRMKTSLQHQAFRGEL